jgi:hypothetical protein
MQNLKSIPRQKGVVVILMAFIIGMGVLAYLLHAFDPTQLRIAQDTKTMQTLNEAKQALIAWSVSHPNTPGLMPYPDRKADGNYDDTADCYASNVNFNYIFVLGRLPLFKNDPNCVNAKNNVVNGVSGDFRDSVGERLWYEVSKNLLHDYKDNGGNPNGTPPIINPGIVNNPTYPWFTVRDRSGAVISSRVAAVIIAPGEPVGGQDRSGGIADPNQYLDKITMADNTVYQNYNYPTSDINVKEFIIGENFKTVANNDPTYKNQSIEPYYYNDKLVYITIDELIAALEKRVGEEIRANLRTYAGANVGNYPFAAVLGGVGSTRKYRCTNNMLRGALPVDNPANTCTYTATATTVNSACNFQDITSVAFRKSTAGNFTTATQACSFVTTTCTCTGAGSCSAGATVFSCNAAGGCSANVAGRIRFLGASLNTSSSAICTLGALSTCVAPANTISRTVTCNGSSPIVTLGYSCAEQITTLPAWFNTNRWQDYVFYETTRPTNVAGITVGSRATGAAVVTSGAPILNSLTAKGSPQANKPSCAFNDYLDSAENLSVNSVYDTTSKQRTNNYNDQTFVVVP